MSLFEQVGCVEDSEYKGVYYHNLLPFSMSENDGFIKLSVNLEYCISDKTIPLTKENLQNLINSFNP